MRSTRKNRTVQCVHTGAALVTVLAVSVILTLLTLGLGIFALSHYNLSHREADYSAAMHLAEAGVNYELRYISKNHLTPNPAHQVNSPYTGSIPGIPGSFTVWVFNQDGSSPWVPPDPMFVHSEGNVNGSVRIVECRGMRSGVFNEFALYAINSGAFGGSGSQVVGHVGTNGTIKSPSSGAGAVQGTLYFGHNPLPGDPTGSNVAYGPPIEWPTIDQIITSAPPYGFGPAGWSWLTSNSPLNRSNRFIRTFAASNPALTPAGTSLAGSPWTGTNANSMKIRATDFNGLRADPSDGKKTLILPPGDYYFTDIDTGGSSGNKIIADTAGLTTGAPGLIRIWMNDSNKNDTININVFYTSTDPRLFRLYYNKCAEISIGGNSTYYGGFYAVRTGCLGQIHITGESTVYGSVIANNVQLSGNSSINFPTGPWEIPGDYGLWYGFIDQYRELPVGGGALFPGGTTN